MTGYTCADLFGSDELLQASEEGLAEIADATEEIEGLTVVVGLPVRFQNNLYNCAAFVSEGTVCALVPKINLPTYSEFYESRWFMDHEDYRRAAEHWKVKDRNNVNMPEDVLHRSMENYILQNNTWPSGLSAPG